MRGLILPPRCQQASRDMLPPGPSQKWDPPSCVDMNCSPAGSLSIPGMAARLHGWVDAICGGQNLKMKTVFFFFFEHF